MKANENVPVNGTEQRTTECAPNALTNGKPCTQVSSLLSALRIAATMVAAHTLPFAPGYSLLRNMLGQYLLVVVVLSGILGSHAVEIRYGIRHRKNAVKRRIKSSAKGKRRSYMEGLRSRRSLNGKVSLKLVSLPSFASSTSTLFPHPGFPFAQGGFESNDYIEICNPPSGKSGGGKSGNSGKDGGSGKSGGGKSGYGKSSKDGRRRRRELSGPCIWIDDNFVPNEFDDDYYTHDDYYYYDDYHMYDDYYADEQEDADDDADDDDTITSPSYVPLTGNDAGDDDDDDNKLQTGVPTPAPSVEDDDDEDVSNYSIDLTADPPAPPSDEEDDNEEISNEGMSVQAPWDDEDESLSNEGTVVVRNYPTLNGGVIGGIPPPSAAPATSEFVTNDSQE